MRLNYRSFITIFVVSFLLVASAAASFYYINLRKQIFLNRLEVKIANLYNPSKPTDILIIGDSRAQRQIDPQVIENTLGRTALNLALNGECHVTALRMLQKYPLIIKDAKLVIFSETSAQINDGAIFEGYITPASFFELSPFDQIRLFPNQIRRIAAFYWNAIKQYKFYKRTDFSKGLCSRLEVENKGLLPIYEKLEGSNFWPTSVNPEDYRWFEKSKFDGIRHRQFIRTLRMIKKQIGSGKKLLFVIPPMSNSWLDMIKGTGLEKVFNQSILALQNACKIADVECIIFDKNAKYEYYDFAHMDYKGAINFTSDLCHCIKEKRLWSQRVR